jgi:hypothetical protein
MSYKGFKITEVYAGWFAETVSGPYRSYSGPYRSRIIELIDGKRTLKN